MKYLITIASVIVMGTFILTGPMCGKGNQAAEQQGKRPEVVIATIEGYPITVDAVEKDPASAARSGDPVQDAQSLGKALQRFVGQGVVLQVAAKNGVTMSDADLVQQETDRQIQMFKFQLMISGQLKDPSDAGFESFLKQSGKTTKDLKDALTKEIQDKVKDPTTRPQVFADLAQQAIESSFAARLNPSDDEVKRQFDSLTLKRIFISAPLSGKDDSADKAKRALADIKGGLTFEAAMNRYSKDRPEKGKTVADSITTLPASTVAADAKLGSLLKLKPGETTDVIEVPGGVAIYKLISLKSAVPPDFEKKKADYRKSYSQNLAHSQVQAQIEEASKDPKIEWKSKGYKSIYDYSKAMMAHAAPDELKKQMRAVMEEAADTGGDEGQRAGTLARFAAETQLYTMASGDEKKKMTQERIEALSQMLAITESTDLRLELADLYEATKQGSLAAQSLLQAARTNNDTDALGQSHFNAINARLEKFKKEGFLAPDDVKGVEAEQTRWKNDRAQREADEAERKKFEEEDRKRAEEDKKKAEAAAKAAPPVVPKIRVTPSTGK